MNAIQQLLGGGSRKYASAIGGTGLVSMNDALGLGLSTATTWQVVVLLVGWMLAQAIVDAVKAWRGSPAAQKLTGAQLRLLPSEGEFYVTDAGGRPLAFHGGVRLPEPVVVPDTPARTP